MYTELNRMREGIDNDINLATQHIFDRITDYNLQKETCIEIDEVEKMCREISETCIEVFKQEIDEFLYSEAQALRPFLEIDPKNND